MPAYDTRCNLGNENAPSTGFPWKKMLAAATVLIMVVGGVAAILPALSTSPVKAPASEPVKAMAGARTVSYEISHFGESYIKNPDITNYQGNRTLTEGLNSWWPDRLSGYNEYVVRNKYPFVTAYTLESGYTTADIDPGFGMTMMARMSIVAKNLPTMGTAKGMDPIFIPILDQTTAGGGNVTLNWRSDVATAQEIAELKAVTSTYFGRVYYAAPKVSLTDDGYWNLIYGNMTFDRAAAQTYLDLPGVGSLMTEFTTANAGNAIGNAWLNDWMTETGGGGIYDTAAGYEYPNDIRQVILSLDPSSTPDKLIVRIWSISWGNDVMLMRYFDASGLNQDMQSYFEDMYFNATIGVTWANITTSYYMQYAVLGWADQVTGAGSWMLEAMHIDYVGSADPPPAWQSRFNPYDPEKVDYTRLSLLPGTTMYGQQVSYYTAPTYWTLDTGETLTVKLPTRGFLGYTPYVGASNTLSVTKVAELNSHSYWGEAVLGNCIPDLKSNYNHATKTIALTGPTSYARNPSPQNSLINYTGVPMFVFDVSTVSDYGVVMQEPAPYVAGNTYHLVITAKNFTGATLASPGWNGIASLTIPAGMTIGGTAGPATAQFAFNPANSGVLTLEAVFTTDGFKKVLYSEVAYPADVTGAYLAYAGPFVKSLYTGWNLISIPLVSSYKASTLPGLVTGDTIVAWNPSSQSYRQYIKGVSPSIMDFNIDAHTGYWIYVSGPRTMNLVGDAARTMQTRTIAMPASGIGWFTVGFQSFDATKKASNIPQMYSVAGKITVVASFDPVTKQYKSWLAAIPGVNNFALVAGMGYWCYTSSSGTLSYMP